MDAFATTLRERLASRRPTRAKDGRPAAVLIPIIATDGDRRLLFTRRSARLRRQPGDISFPGGAIDPEDASPLHAALRESGEEVGLDAGDVDVLGQMDERTTVTGFRITPFVGWIRGPYAFKTNHEVAELFEVPIDALRQPGVLEVEKRFFRGAMREVYHYYYRDYDIWGITGRLVRELLELAP